MHFPAIHPRLRSGASLVEMLLFISIVALVSTALIPLLFSSTESRQRQDAIALVEQNGAQILQILSQEIRSAERVLDPARGGTGHVLALQTSSGATNPTIFALYSGAIIMVQGRERRTLTSTQVGVTHFNIDNTSTSDDFQSVVVNFGLRRIIRLHQPLTYDANFDAVITLFPDDDIGSADCDCLDPFCDSSGSGHYVWHWCNTDNECIPHGDFDCVFED